MAASIFKRERSNRPSLRTLEPTEGERHASWLELFFDLVYVLAVSQIAHMLSEHSDLGGMLKYIALFVPVWWSWVGYTFYADRFETEEIAYRVMMFAGMLAIIALSLTLSESFTLAGDRAFIVSYVLVRVALVVLYVRSAYYVPLARSFSGQFIFGLGLSCVLLLLSLLFSPPVRYIIWGIALALELATPFLNLKATRIFPIDRSHIPERFGLFTIIVLGEAVISTANGASKVVWSVGTMAAALMGFAMAACIWWINFDFVEDSGIKSRTLFPRLIYLFGHLFIVGSIVALGIGVEHSIKETAEAHLHLPTLALLAGSLAVFLTTITVIRLVADVCYLINARIISVGVSLSFIYFGQFLPPLIVLAALLLILATGVVLESLYAGENEETEEEPHLIPCEHADQMTVFHPRSEDGCEECRKNNYKWVHLRLCLSCGHVGCCDTSIHKHATRHFGSTEHPVIASLEPGENWAWCYVDERFVPLPRRVGKKPGEA
ncbi:MAG: low temperature requirement protein A [Pyrinomonadaceae bacterium]